MIPTPWLLFWTTHSVVGHLPWSLLCHTALSIITLVCHDTYTLTAVLNNTLYIGSSSLKFVMSHSTVHLYISLCLNNTLHIGSSSLKFVMSHSTVHLYISLCLNNTLHIGSSSLKFVMSHSTVHLYISLSWCLHHDCCTELHHSYITLCLYLDYSTEQHALCWVIFPEVMSHSTVHPVRFGMSHSTVHHCNGLCRAANCYDLAIAW